MPQSTKGIDNHVFSSIWTVVFVQVIQELQKALANAQRAPNPSNVQLCQVQSMQKQNDAAINATMGLARRDGDGEDEFEHS